MKEYLHYDVKGIQSFIFKIPKLKHIVGGSALVDRFDRETVKKIAKNLKTGQTERIFSGGGKGIFHCDSKETAQELKEELILSAHQIGMDIQFGLNEDFIQAAQHADEFYPFIPDELDGVPCPESGLYPVPDEKKPHHVVEKRISTKDKDLLRRFEQRLLPEVSILGKPTESFQFFRNVNAEDPDDPNGKLGAFAIGNRNRWAVICMDGNDMGKQFREQLGKEQNGEEYIDGLKNMSQTLYEITTQAASAGTQRVVTEWAGSEKGKEAIANEDMITLPIRPLFVGGDDIVVLCHCSYALTFVKEVMRVFEELSKNHSALWPATQNGLTISAGILYTSVTLPLHTAIPYAEALLEGAKSCGRKKAAKGEAPPASIDWEQITETVVDTPEEKRKRELIFFDAAIERTVKLTRRPYTMESFSEVETLSENIRSHSQWKLPRTIRHRILPALRKGESERLAFYAEIKKNHLRLFEQLNELDMKKSRWLCDIEKEEQSIDLIDALILLEEDDRMRKETVK